MLIILTHNLSLISVSPLNPSIRYSHVLRFMTIGKLLEYVPNQTDMPTPSGNDTMVIFLYHTSCLSKWSSKNL